MLKLFFWLLLAVNGLLFAYERGYLESIFPSGREPARMASQLNAAKVKIVPPPAAKPATEPEVPPAEPAASPQSQPTQQPAQQP